MIPTTKDSENEIIKMQNDAREKGLEGLQINALKLHKRVGYDPHNHRMPVICQAMYNLMTRRDELIYSPPKGKGTRLTILYHL